MYSHFRTIIASVILIYGCFLSVFPQNTDTLSLLENKLLFSYKMIIESPEDNRYKASEVFYDKFDSVLSVEGSFDYPFSSLEKIGKIYSPDHRLRVFTWNIPVDLSGNIYYGIILFYSEITGKHRIVLLNRLDSLPYDVGLTSWIGSLYYSIIETKHAGRKYYTLLGFDLNNPLSNKKVIEVISIDDFDRLYFCKNLLQYQGKLVDRIVFEYNEKAVMSLQYNDTMKMIVFDHLSPSKPSLTDQYEFYGPDFTYDGLKWEKGIWVYYSNIDVTN